MRAGPRIPNNHWERTGFEEELQQEAWETRENPPGAAIIHQLKKLRRAYDQSRTADWTLSIRGNLTHLHQWEWDEAETTIWGKCLTGACGTCNQCLATTSSKERRPLAWSPFHLRN